MLEKLDRAYGRFHVFQVFTLIAGTCAILFSDSPLYLIFLFGQVISMIVFGIVTANLTESSAQKKYPDIKPENSFHMGPGSFRYSVDLNRPIREKAKKTDDQLLLDIMTKQTRMWFLCIVDLLVLGVLASTMMGAFAPARP